MGNEDPERNVLSSEMGDRKYLTQPGKVTSKLIACELGIRVGLRIVIFSWGIK